MHIGDNNYQKRIKVFSTEKSKIHRQNTVNSRVISLVFYCLAVTFHSYFFVFELIVIHVHNCLFYQYAYD